jgi:hypothetical protein
LCHVAHGKELPSRECDSERFSRTQAPASSDGLNVRSRSPAQVPVCRYQVKSRAYTDRTMYTYAASGLRSSTRIPAAYGGGRDGGDRKAKKAGSTRDVPCRRRPDPHHHAKHPTKAAHRDRRASRTTPRPARASLLVSVGSVLGWSWRGSSSRSGPDRPAVEHFAGAHARTPGPARQRPACGGVASPLAPARTASTAPRSDPVVGCGASRGGSLTPPRSPHPRSPRRR